MMIRRSSYQIATVTEADLRMRHAPRHTASSDPAYERVKESRFHWRVVIQAASWVNPLGEESLFWGAALPEGAG